MHLPKETVAGKKSFDADSEVYLEGGHICVKRDTAEKIFGADNVVLSVFYAKDNSFLVAPASEDLFRRLHKANQQMLKTKNNDGDKSISIQELLLDHDINENDRNLEFKMEEAMHLLKVKL